MLRIYRFFVVASAVVIMAVIAVLGAMNYRQTVGSIIQMAESQSVSMARALSDIMWSRFGDYVSTAPKRSVIDLRASREVRELDAMLLPLRDDLSILKVKIYSPRGFTLYSSDHTQIGEGDHDTGTVTNVARTRKPLSKLSYKDRISAFSGEIFNRDVVETYVPVNSAGGELVGVFEIYTDVTTTKERIERIFFEMVTQLTVAFLVMYGTLVLIVRRRVVAPLRQASDRAANIGPQHPGMRLSVAHIPIEVVPLVHAVNGAVDRLEKALDAQRRFAADAAHELLTPLAVLTAHLDTLDDKRTVVALRQDVQGITDIVTQLLHLAEIDGQNVPPAEPVDVYEVCAAAVADLAPLAIGQGKSIALSGSDHPPRVLCDSKGLASVLRNLIKNAVTATAGGTTVEVDVGDDGSVRVIDCGPGIAPGDREAIFERFRRGRDARSPGAGLGLSIVRHFVDIYGGSINVDDAPTGGAMFILRLPGV